jgi:predicted nicotinamide N-methyase
MPGYQTRQQDVAVAGAASLTIRSLLDQSQFSDPLGTAARLGISSALWPLFGMLWPSGAQLAAWMARLPLQPGVRMLEVGCGLALASLVGHRRGADITASDQHPLAGKFLAQNLRLNRLAPMKYRHGDWAATAAPGLQDGARWTNAVRGRFDIIVGSDLLYDRDASTALASFIERHAAPQASVWIVDPDRANRPAFSRLMAAAGFRATRQRLDHAADAQGAAYKGQLLGYAR